MSIKKLTNGSTSLGLINVVKSNNAEAGAAGITGTTNLHLGMTAKAFKDTLNNNAVKYGESESYDVSFVSGGVDMINAFNENASNLEAVLQEGFCVVSFVTTPIDTVVVVKDSEGVEVAAEGDGTYNLVIGSYTYTASADTFDTLSDVVLDITNDEIIVGTEDIVIELVETI